MSSNYHALYVNSDGTLYWSERVNSNECGEAEYYGRKRDYWHLDTVGLGSCGWNGDDYAVYATRPTTSEEQAEINTLAADGERQVQLESREFANKSRGPECGYEEGVWYVQTSALLHWTEAHDGLGAEEFMADALDSLEGIPVGFFDGEEPGDEWESMK